MINAAGETGPDDSRVMTHTFGVGSLAAMGDVKLTLEQ